jgi:2-iminobutanoate/2-iminopropanoate deaminase
MKNVIHSDRAPAAVGPYSQAVESRGVVFASGQIPLDPSTGALVAGGIEAQTGQALDNLRAVLEAAECSLADVARTTVYLTDLDDFDAVNAVYARYFGDRPPARVCVQVCRLPRGARIEIDAIALKGSAALS